LKLQHVEAVVLAGGESSRMGRDKATLTVDGVAMAERVARALDACFARVRVVVRPGSVAPVALPAIEDRHAERGAMVGIAAALAAAEAPWVAVAACDLPFVEPTLLLALCALAPVESDHDVVAPLGPRGPEPLLALYRTRLLPELERRIAARELALRDLLQPPRLLAVPVDELRGLDPTLASLRNVNRAEDLTGPSTH
jgi:molybdopterin-guanine dinucleotide biosynthesis protein A